MSDRQTVRERDGQDPCPAKTRSDLEWDRLLSALAERCHSPAGKAAAHALPFLTSVAQIETAFAEVREIVALQEREGVPLPLQAVPDVDSGVERARMGATLSNVELRDVLRLLLGAGSLRKFLRAREASMPSLTTACPIDPKLDDLARKLDDCFDADGTLSDRASPRLRELRASWRASRDRLIRRLEDMMKQQASIMQDTYWTERDGRYVLPVRADAHERFPGIVHATSDSGQTLFVEPRAIVPMGNRHKMLEAEVAREEEAIYTMLSGLVADQVESVAAAAASLAHADLRQAVTQLRNDLDLNFPEVHSPAAGATGQSYELRAGRHPLLLLDGVDVVPSDISLSDGHALVLSGPNAGGKTVALKVLGLAALMVRAGLPVAAAEGSRVRYTERVLTDVGDEQNLHKNLSTFSAHVTNLAAILDDTHDGVLVLLDELAGGTDPKEGEALAAAVLDSLCARGGAVACTTHYEGLKVLALRDTRFGNASVGFDMEQMQPTFRVTMGVPGTSSALAVARRFGISPVVVERAQSMLGQESLSLAEMTDRLAAEVRAAELARSDAQREAEQLALRKAELEAELERLRAKEKASITKEGSALLAQLRRAREDLRAAQAKVRGRRPAPADIDAAEKAIDGVSKQVALGGGLEEATQPELSAALDRAPVDESSVRVGARVYVPRIRGEAEVLEVLSNGQLRVAAGPLKLLTSVSEVRKASGRDERRSAGTAQPLPPAKGTKRRRGGRAEADAPVDATTPMQTTDNTVDVRGLRAHEAVAMAEQFVDRCVGAEERVAFVIHGHGTGALREAIRAELARSPVVSHVEAAPMDGGGEGVTVVWLR